MSALSEKVLSQISESAVTPTERWKFSLKRSFIWTAAALVSIFASFALALTVHVIFEVDWGVYQELGFNWLQIMQSLSPLVWLFCLSTLLVAGVILLRRTRHGYRYSLMSMFSLLLVSGIAMAATFEQWPNEEQIEASLMYKIPGYRHFEAQILPSVEKQWSQPEAGLLGGTITTLDADDALELRDFKDKTWQIDTGSASIGESVQLEEGQDVKIIGTTGEDDRFHATEVRPWKASSVSGSSRSSGSAVKKESSIKESDDEKKEAEKIKKDEKKDEEEEDEDEKDEDEEEDHEDEHEEEPEHEEEY